MTSARRSVRDPHWLRIATAVGPMISVNGRRCGEGAATS